MPAALCQQPSPHPDAHTDVLSNSAPRACSWATYYLISWLAAVHQIGEEDSILGARQPAGRHFAGTLLNSDALVVLIDGLRGTQKVTGACLCMADFAVLQALTYYVT